MKKITKKLGKYEIGRTIGEGTFAKVKFAKNTDTGESAVKVLAKTTILKHGMVDQIKREISIMKIVKHPNIVRLHEVLASRKKIYIILEFVSGGELFDKIVHRVRLSENECRQYFQQLIDAVAHCHSKGVYHRDLKPENLLLDSSGNLKVSDFGLSGLTQQGYDGAAADVWSCGVILFVIMAGYLPFDEIDLPTLYKKISVAQFSCPPLFSPGAKSLIQKILDPNPKTRIQIEGIKKDPWFMKHYVPVKPRDEEVSLDDVLAVFDDIEDQYVSERPLVNEGGPLIMNAFEMITLSQGLNLSALFDRQQDRQYMSDYVKRQTRFVSRKPARVIISSVDALAESMGLKTRLEGRSANKVGQFAVVLEVFEVAPSLFMVDVRKAAGDTLEYHKFYKNFCAKLEMDVMQNPTHKHAEASDSSSAKLFQPTAPQIGFQRATLFAGISPPFLPPPLLKASVEDESWPNIPAGFFTCNLNSSPSLLVSVKSSANCTFFFSLFFPSSNTDQSQRFVLERRSKGSRPTIQTSVTGKYSALLLRM
ncbi:CBL-interacting protein kinase 8 [Hibiscus syriacus]|uniref:non-specific serine/threonine protein kinase n=1 Tax=Hibiscus syriacus TaxID=106335 RepID=A0A6A3BSL7_HIBSY|nr:CBL-interacting protein kinase 8 [Hibiscus syriacus]